MINRVVAASALLFAAHAGAQTVVLPAPSVAAQTAIMVPQQVQADVLRAGAPVPVALSEMLTTKGKSLKVGQIVRLEVAQDVLLNGRVVIPARSLLLGRVLVR